MIGRDNTHVFAHDGTRRACNELGKAQIQRRMVGLCGIGGRITVRCAGSGPEVSVLSNPITNQVTPSSRYWPMIVFGVAEYMKKEEENLDEF